MTRPSAHARALEAAAEYFPQEIRPGWFVDVVERAILAAEEAARADENAACVLACQTGYVVSAGDESYREGVRRGREIAAHAVGARRKEQP